MSPRLREFFTKNPRPDAITGLFLFAFTFLVYLMTLAPGVYGFDSAELATGVFTKGIVHPPGYPLYILVGRLFISLPIRDVAYRLNLMSAFFASCTVVLLYLTARKLNVRRILAFTASGVFAFSVYFWQMALVAEVYTLHTTLIGLCLLMIVCWRNTGNILHLILFSFCYGLSLTNHTSSILFMPGFALMILCSKHWRWKQWWILPCMLVCFLIGLLPYAYFPASASAHPALDYADTYDVDASSLSGIWWMASSQTYRFFAFAYDLQELPRELLRFGEFLWRNFLGVGVLVGAVGIYRLWSRRRGLAVGLLVSFAAVAVFYINYRVVDKDTMFLPCYLVWALFLAAGFMQVYDWILAIISKGIPKIAVSIAGGIALAVMLLAGVSLNWQWVSLHDAHEYRDFAQVVLTRVEPDAVVIAPWSQAAVLEYYQLVEGQRPDLVIVNRSRRYTLWYYELWKEGMDREGILRQIEQNDLDFLLQEIDERAVYTVEYDPVWAEHFDYRPEGNIYRLEESSHES